MPKDAATGMDGWQPPVMYDQTNDTWRAVKQDDYDQLAKIAAAYGELIRLVRHQQPTLHYPAI